MTLIHTSLEKQSKAEKRPIGLADAKVCSSFENTKFNLISDFKVQYPVLKKNPPLSISY